MTTAYPSRQPQTERNLAPIYAITHGPSHAARPPGILRGSAASPWQDAAPIGDRMPLADMLSPHPTPMGASTASLTSTVPLTPVTSRQPILAQTPRSATPTPAESAARLNARQNRTHLRPALTLALTLPGNLVAMGGLETLAWGHAGGHKKQLVAGAFMLAAGLGAALAPSASQHKDLVAMRPKSARAWSAASTLGTAVLLAGAGVRFLGQRHASTATTAGSMALIATGAMLTVGANATSFADCELNSGRLPLRGRPQFATFSLSAGVVTAIAYGLSVRLNNFSMVTDYAVFSAAYTLVANGIMLQFADNRHFAMRHDAAQDLLDSPKNWVPLGLVTTIIAAHVPLLIGVKLLLDGVIINSSTYLLVGATVACLSFAAITAPQIYFHEKIERCGAARAWAITTSVVLGAILLGVGAGVREWAAANQDISLAQAAMAIVGLGAFTVAGCAHESLHHGEWMRGRAPIANRPMVSLITQAVGVSMGIAYGLGIRHNRFNALIDDAVLSLSFVTTLVGSSLQYADSRWHEECASAEGEEVALRALA